LVEKRIIQELLGRVHIEDVVGTYVSLKRSGNSLRGLCPFHSETSPSFYVSPSKGVYYCFGCRAGGNAIKFLQEMEGKSFMEVVRELAEREGIEIPKEEFDRHRDEEEKQKFARRRRHLELLGKISEIYEKVLWQSPAGKNGRKYLEKRGIDEKIARDFRLGYAPPEGIGIESMLGKLHASLQDAQEVGLLKTGRDGKAYEIFRGRVIFPITITGGDVVAFSGRALPGTEEEEKTKYINSPESPYFRKGNILFGLPRALPHIRRNKRVIIVEGNFDVISMAQAGFENVVAPLGSALTPKHVEHLKRLDVGITLLFDGDAAGMRAAVKAGEVIIPSGISTGVALLPEGYDPHSLLIEKGKDAVEKVLDSSTELFDFLISEVSREAGDSEIERVKGLRKAWEILKQTPDDLVRVELLKKMAQAFKLNEREVRKHLGRQSDATQSYQPPNDFDDYKNAKQTRDVSFKREYEILLQAVMEYPSIAPQVFKLCKDVVEDFSVLKVLRVLADTIEQETDKQKIGTFILEEFFEREVFENNEIRDYVMSIAMNDAKLFESEDSAKKGIIDVLGKLKKEKLDREIEIINKKAKEARGKGNFDEYQKILIEKQNLCKQAKKIIF